eukprot:g780.t1
MGWSREEQRWAGPYLDRKAAQIRLDFFGRTCLRAQPQHEHGQQKGHRHPAEKGRLKANLCVEYDPSQVSYDDLLDVFYKGCSAESGGKPQYKSAIWVHSGEQRTVAEEAATQRGKQGLHILDQQHWTDAEETNGDDVYRNAGSMWKLTSRRMETAETAETAINRVR